MIYNGSKTKEARLKMIDLLNTDKDFDSIHDVLFEFYESFPTLEESYQNEIYIKLLMEVPDGILGDAYINGFSDTEVRDYLYTFIQNNKEEIDKLLNIN